MSITNVKSVNAGSQAAAPEKDVPMLTDNALVVLQKRYLDRNEHGITETPAQLFKRVARCVASCEYEDEIDKYTDRFYDLMVNGRFMPNSPTLMNAGRRFNMLSACFVLPLDDAIDSIFKTISDIALVQRAGGGVGIPLDDLRPCGSFVGSSGGHSSGPIAFWRVASETTCAIQQGSFRRGANMGMMGVTHPDIIKFLYAKQDLKQFTNYNISVKVTDEFMRQVQLSPGTPHIVKWQNRSWYIPRALIKKCEQAVADGISGVSTARDLDVCYSIHDLTPVGSINSNNNDVVTVGELFDIIINNAWKTGEPGLCFIDRIRETEPTPDVFLIQSTNPCGEQPLGPNESCNLGSINLAKYVIPFWQAEDGGKAEDKSVYVNWTKLAKDIATSVRFLDNVVTVNRYPTEDISKVCQANRKIGLGIMGFADALIKLGVQYDSEEGMAWGERFMRFVNDKAIQASSDLADERGVFPNWDRSKWKAKNKKLRNACVTTVAPTGTISIIANCSGGIEPLFSWAFVRQVLNGEKLWEVNAHFKSIAQKFGFDKPEVYEYAAEHGSIQNCDLVPASFKKIFRSARDISPTDHVTMQAMFQRHTTSAISKTINLPHSATVLDVKKAYLTASSLGCKGVTVYRDGCRSCQPMALKKTDTPEVNEESVVIDAPLFREPVDVSSGVSVRMRYNTTYGKLHTHISLAECEKGKFREREVFFNLGRSGDSTHALTDSFGRLASTMLRLDAPITTVIDQFRGFGASNEPRNDTTGSNTSLPNELAIALLTYYEATRSIRDDNGLLTQIPTEDILSSNLKKTVSKKSTCAATVNHKSNGKDTRDANFVNRVKASVNVSSLLSTPCPTANCTGTLIFAEGCKKCMICGHSSCS